MNYIVTLNILPKDNLLDPQGKAVLAALHDLEMFSTVEVRVGKSIRIAISADSQSQAEEIARTAASKLLVNPISEQYSLVVNESK